MADLFDIVTARKLSGGGGGSSDFSTAQVTTIINGGGDELTTSSYYGIPFTVARGIDFYMESVPLSETDYETGDYYNEISIILYEGHAELTNIDVDGSTITDITVTGNGSYYSDSGIVDVTGDCTINITTA